MNKKQKNKLKKILQNKKSKCNFDSFDIKMKKMIEELYPNTFYGKLNSLFHSFKYRYYEPFIDIFKYDIPQGLKSVLQWMPIIWKDRHWDYGYLYIILEYKLKKMEECILNGYTCNREKDIKKIKQCLFLIKRIKDYEYCESERYKYLEKNVGIIAAIEYEEYVYRNDVQTLFKIIANNIHRWWD